MPAEHRSVRNRLLWAGIVFEIALAAAVVYLPAANDLLDTRPLGMRDVGVLAAFPLVVWGADEILRALRRRRVPPVRSGREESGLWPLST